MKSLYEFLRKTSFEKKVESTAILYQLLLTIQDKGSGLPLPFRMGWLNLLEGQIEKRSLFRVFRWCLLLTSTFSWGNSALLTSFHIGESMEVPSILDFISAPSALPTEIAVELVPYDEPVLTTTFWTRRVVLATSCRRHLFWIQAIFFCNEKNSHILLLNIE